MDYHTFANSFTGVIIENVPLIYKYWGIDNFVCLLLIQIIK